MTATYYHWIGRPDLSTAKIREIIAKNFNGSRRGLPGNDDSGAMSSWVAFHMLGLFPNAGQSYYLINLPFTKESVIHVADGRRFTIIARNTSDKKIYIKSAKLNNKPLNQSWIEHSEIVNGGVLELEMTDKPSEWGNMIFPPSIGNSN